MIVVIGSPILRRAATGGAGEVAGLAGRVALAAASANRRVQLVGKVGDDDAGDTLLIALAAGAVGHAAVLRDAANPTPIAVSSDEGAEQPSVMLDEPDEDLPAGLPLDAADITLALRYLTEFGVVVLAAPVTPDVADAAMEAAAFAGAHVVRLDGGVGTAAEPDSSITAFEPPAGDEPAFAALVGAYAAALDAGRSPADAFAAATGATNWERAPTA